jgi:hypothetical protein
MPDDLMHDAVPGIVDKIIYMPISQSGICFSIYIRIGQRDKYMHLLMVISRDPPNWDVTAVLLPISRTKKRRKGPDAAGMQ